MPTLVKGLHGFDMTSTGASRLARDTVSRNQDLLRSEEISKDTAKPCTCHDAPATDARTIGTALDRALAPAVEAQALAAQGLRHYGVDGNSGKRVGFNAKARQAWGR